MILITGATGFIGQTLTNNLLVNGHSVRVLTRNPEKAKSLFPKAEIVKADIVETDLKPHMKKIHPVFHLAGMTSYTLPQETIFRSNLEGTKKVIEAAREVEKFIFASSASVYGETKGKATELTVPHPVTVYAESKLQAETVVENSVIPTLSLRLCNVYGSGSPSWNEILKFYSKGYPLPKINTNIHLIYVSDASRAFVLGMKKGLGIYNIAGEKSMSFIELSSLLCYYLGVSPKYWPFWIVKNLSRLTGKSKELEAFTRNREYDISKAKKDLGFQPEAYLEKEIRRMVEDFKSI